MRPVIATALLLCWCPAPATALHLPRHDDTWAIVVGASRFWFNHNHADDALLIYRTLRSMGMPDNRILLLIAGPSACDSRSAVPGVMMTSNRNRTNLFGADVEIDYRGYEVTAEGFLALLTGGGGITGRRLHSGAGSNVLVFLAGHGGDGFFKFQDAEEITSESLGVALSQMWVRRRYRRLLLVADTCQAATLRREIVVPNVAIAAASDHGEMSYPLSYHRGAGVPLVDRFTHHFVSLVTSNTSAMMSDLLVGWDAESMLSNIVLDTSRLRETPDRVRLTQFFAPPSRGPIPGMPVVPPRSRGPGAPIRNQPPRALSWPVDSAGPGGWRWVGAFGVSITFFALVAVL